MPAKAGTQWQRSPRKDIQSRIRNLVAKPLDSRLRGNDENAIALVPALRREPNRGIAYDTAMEAVIGISAGIGGALLAALLVWLRLNSRLAAMRERATALEQRIEERDSQYQRLRQDAAQQVREMRAQQAKVDERRQAADVRVATLETELRAREQQFAEHQRVLDDAERRLSEAFEQVGSRALDANSERFIELAHNVLSTYMSEARGDVDQRRQAVEQLVTPIRDLLDRQNQAVADLESKRTDAYRGITREVASLAAETDRLIEAMRRPASPGGWGAMQLRNAIELAGMREHCDFRTPDHDGDGDGNGQPREPDMTVRLPGEGWIAVDASLEMAAYLDALQPDADRDAAMKRFADELASHVQQLADERYWAQFERSPRLVVLFVPLEAALAAAACVRPDLHERAMQRDVLIVTPTLLVALLRAVVFGWQEESVREHARQIAAVGRALRERLTTYISHVSGLGAALNEATAQYNRSVGALQQQVLPSADRLRDLEPAVQPSARPSRIASMPASDHSGDHARVNAADRHSGDAGRGKRMKADGPGHDRTAQHDAPAGEDESLEAPQQIERRAHDVTAAELRSLTDESD